MRSIAVLASLVFLAGCGAAPESARPGRAAPQPEAPVIVDADAYGLVYLDAVADRYVGVDRSGATVWTAPAGRDDPVAVGCLARCPDAVLSGSPASLNAAGVPDPQPVLVVDGRREPLTVLSGPKRWVLTANGPGDLIAHAGDGAGRWWLELLHAGAATRVEVGGSRTSWREDPSGRHGLAISGAGGQPSEVRFFDRYATGWRMAGEVARVKGATACLDPAGTRALLVGQRPVLLDRTGAVVPVTDLERAGTCALGASGGIVADLGRNPHGARSQVHIFAADGVVTRRNETSTDVTVTADPAGARVAYLSGGTFLEIDPRTGAILRSLTGIQAARYDDVGALVVVRTGGEAAWV